MRQQRRRAFKRIYLAAGAALIACLAFSGYSYARYADEALRPDTEAHNLATIEEAYFQALPEERTAPDALKIPIFIYHSVRPISPTDSSEVRSYEIPPELFERQLKYLQDNGYATITMDQVVEDLKAGTTSPVAKPVVLTFDDGWENQYVYAFPLLKKYHMTATFYVYTNPIGTKHWLTWDQLKEMQNAGMIIEDHSLTHPRFKGLSLDQAKKEMADSKKVLESKLGVTVNHFASPYGYENADLMALAKTIGYDSYRTTYKGVYQDNPLHLRGILMTNDFSYFVDTLKR